MESIKFDRQNNSIDVYKLIMAFAVVAIHTDPLINCNNEDILNVYGLSVGLAVPFFFLASGYLLAIKMKYPYNSDTDFSRVKGQLLKITKMYLYWTLIYCPMSIYHFITTETSLVKAILLYVRGMIFLGEQYNSWPLWYLLSTIYALFVILIIIRIKKSPRALIFVSVISSIISISFSILISYDSILPVGLSLLKKLIKCSIATGRIFSGTIYIPIGMLIAHKRISKLLNWILFCAGFIGNFFINNAVVSGVLLIFTSIGLFGIVESIKLRDNEVYGLMRNMSTIIYLIHMYIWSFYYKFIYGEKTYGLDSFIVTAVVSSFVALIYLYYKKCCRKRKQVI